MEPIRRVLTRLSGHFIRASAESVDLENKLVEVSQVMANGEKRSFYVPYDKLVIGVGEFILRVEREEMWGLTVR